MNIALVNPKTDIDKMRMIYDRHENLALGLLSGYLKQNCNHNIKLFDLRVDNLSILEFIDQIRNIDIIALSVNYVTLASAIEISQEIKIFNKDIIVIFGGEHATYLDKELLDEYSEYIDFIIRGEAEQTTLELINEIDDKKNYSKVKSISYKNNNKINTNRK